MNPPGDVETRDAVPLFLTGREGAPGRPGTPYTRAMPVAFDAVLVAALARELDARLRGARLRALRLDRPGRELALLFREGTLRFGLHPESGGVGWLEPVDPGPHDRPLAARVRAVEAVPDDRVLRLALRRVRGAPGRVDVIVEWITKRWNAVVTEGPERVVRHLLVEMDGERAPRAGRPWMPPAATARAGVDGGLDGAAWRALLGAVPAAGRRRALLDGVAWTSALNADALLGDAARDDEAGAALDAGYALWRTLADVAGGRRAALPVLLRRGSLPQPYPAPLGDGTGEPARSLLDAFARAAAEAGAAAAVVPAAQLDALRERVVRAWARVESLATELAEAPEPAALRAAGDLLLARIQDVPRGAARAMLVGFDDRPVEVELDPRRAPHEQAPAYYERAARAERARARLPRLVDEARAEARRLEALLERAAAGEEPAAMVAAEVARGPRPAAPAEAAPALPYRTYTSSGGLEIRVGRGARQNDELTFHHASPDDVWLHARHAAGAHVVLRWRGETNPPARDLAEAATLAALHSKARTSGSVPVDWTRRKYVRKPRKAPPGQVLVERAKTLFVAPDPGMEERLRRAEG